MTIKEFIKSVLQSFFVIVTLVNVSTLILGLAFQPDYKFGYEAFLSPLIYGFLGILPSILMYSKNELSIRQIVIRKLFQFIALELILFFVGFKGFGAEPKIVVSFLSSVAVIFVLVHIITWFIDSKSAKELTQELQMYQKHKEQEL